MCIICQNCGSIAEYNINYGKVICTRCTWKSEQLPYEDANKYSTYNGDIKNAPTISGRGFTEKLSESY